MYVVVALHNAGCRESEALIQVTPDEESAIRIAQSAEKLGYEFRSYGTGVTVYRPVGDRWYLKQDYVSEQNPPPDYPVIYARRKLGNGDWHEEWFDKDVEKRYQF